LREQGEQQHRTEGHELRLRPSHPTGGRDGEDQRAGGVEEELQESDGVVAGRQLEKQRQPGGTDAGPELRVTDGK